MSISLDAPRRPSKRPPMVMPRAPAARQERAERIHSRRPRAVMIGSPRAPVTFKGATLAVGSILAGVVAMIVAVACVILGALTLNPFAIGAGVLLGAAGVALMSAGGAYFGLRGRA